MSKETPDNPNKGRIISLDEERRKRALKAVLDDGLTLLPGQMQLHEAFAREYAEKIRIEYPYLAFDTAIYTDYSLADMNIVLANLLHRGSAGFMDPLVRARDMGTAVFAFLQKYDRNQGE
jgi:hypothetical protein